MTTFLLEREAEVDPRGSSSPAEKREPRFLTFKTAILRTEVQRCRGLVPPIGLSSLAGEGPLLV